MKRGSRRSICCATPACPIAIATDCNPGTSPVLNPQLVMNMACTLFGLTPEEAIAGMTINAARALGLAHEIGTIEAGKAADLCVWRVERTVRNSAIGSGCRARNGGFSRGRMAKPARQLAAIVSQSPTGWARRLAIESDQLGQVIHQKRRRNHSVHSRPSAFTARRPASDRR